MTILRKRMNRLLPMGARLLLEQQQEWRLALL